MKLEKINILKIVNPKLSREWHPSKNGKLSPKDVTIGSDKKVWWKCEKGHEWEASISHRHHGRGCPYCSGNKVNNDNCLNTKNPKLAKEWHPTKNGTLTPRNITIGSNKIVWWLCKKGHEWKAIVNGRNKGIGCPYCGGKKVNKDNCLETVNPDLAKEWHHTRNGKLTPKDVTTGSGKKVWWICKKGHEWKATIASRNSGACCPYCSGRYASKENNLEKTNPILSREWHKSKNGRLAPKDVTPGSHKKVWWICNKGHEWEAVIKDRNAGNGCIFCCGKKVNKDNCLETLNPKLSKEWHPTKNGTLTPRDVTTGSHKKVWWLCKNGHEWEASIAHRTNGRGCPFETYKTSQIELRIYSELKKLFGDVHLRKKVHGVECDILLPRINLAVEFDGYYWHKDKFKKDIKKNIFLKKHNLTLINVRENGLKKISENDVLYTYKDTDFELMNRLLRKLLKIKNIYKLTRKKIEDYLSGNVLIADDEYLKIIELLPSPLPEVSLKNLDKKLSEEWHPTKNGKLTPKDVTIGSNKKVWWLCNHGHEWKTTVAGRNRGRGCPYCSGRYATNENNLRVSNPSLAKEWHPTKNGKLLPEDFTPSSGQIVWWLCRKGHDWKATVVGRNRGSGCPYCSGRYATIENNLNIINPKLAKQWHPAKNSNLTPKDVTPGSEKKVWWVCKKGHEWEASIVNRNKGRGCPFCCGKRVNNDNCLNTLNPKLAKEWHPTKNGKLTPKDVTIGSHKKVWWICKKGHEWEASISHRHHGRGCPYCSGKKVNDENCLQTINPDLAREWHPTRNGKLTPRNVTTGSSKKVWWICKKGHEWKAFVYSRNAGTGCPFCN